MNVSLIVCHTRNRVIGAGNRMPWHLPADLKRFRETTMGHAIVMGRKTFETLNGRALPGRRNIVMSRRRLQHPGFEVAADCNALENMVGEARFFVIGGSEIYRLFLPLADTIHRTLIEAELDGDTFFPELDPREWQTRETGSREADEHNRYPLRFSELNRLDPPDDALKAPLNARPGRFTKLTSGADLKNSAEEHCSTRGRSEGGAFNPTRGDKPLCRE